MDETKRVEMVTPRSIDRASFGLPPADEVGVVAMTMLLEDGDPEDACGRQDPCADCKEWVAPGQGCYAPKDLPADWRAVEPFASQACATEGCTCWGGNDRECEDCWLSLK